MFHKLNAAPKASEIAPVNSDVRGTYSNRLKLNSTFHKVSTTFTKEFNYLCQGIAHFIFSAVTTEMTQKGLAALFRRLGARDPEAWARSQLKEEIPQLARFLFLGQAWRTIIGEEDATWIDAKIARAGREPNEPFAGVGRRGEVIQPSLHQSSYEARSRRSGPTSCCLGCRH